MRSRSVPPAAKPTKTVTLPPLQPRLGSSKGEKSGEKAATKTKKKKEQSTKSSAVEKAAKIDCPAAVSRLLTQKSSGQGLASDPYSGSTMLSSLPGGSGRHEREAKFLKRVDQIAKEERANKLRWLEITYMLCTNAHFVFIHSTSRMLILYILCSCLAECLLYS